MDQFEALLELQKQCRNVKSITSLRAMALVEKRMRDRYKARLKEIDRAKNPKTARTIRQRMAWQKMREKVILAELWYRKESA